MALAPDKCLATKLLLPDTSSILEWIVNGIVNRFRVGNVDSARSTLVVVSKVLICNCFATFST